VKIGINAIAAAAVTLLSAHAAHAQAANEKGWLHVGIAHIGFHPKVDVSAGGGPFANIADARLSSNTAFAFDLGYEVSPNVILSIMAGIPPTTTLSSAATGGNLGSIKYGPAVFSGHYHFDLGAVKPYVGVGAAYAMVFSSKDAGLTDLNVKSAWGSALVAGIDIPITKSLGAYVDVRKLRIKTTATAAAGVVKSNVRLDPVTLSAGLSLRF